MGMFDTITGKAQEILGKVGGEQSGLIKGVMEMFQDKQTGGLQGLIQSFQQRGMGDIVSSWISKGPNKPISPDQVKEGMGRERIEKVAAKAGLSTDETANKLSQHLPDIVDKLTPEGTVPEGGMLDKGIDFIKSKLS